MMNRFPRLAFVVSALVVLAFGSASTSCKDKTGPASETTDDSKVALPRVDDSREGLLFTWIDARGEFHVEEKTTSVPLEGRDVVRVVDPSRDEPPGRVFLADLRNAKPDGTYAVRITTRAELDKIAEERRAKSGLTTLASASVPPSSSAAPGAPAANASAPVIIYGASWCGPCHQAEAYLKQKGVPVVKKDIEADSSAQREMRAKLAKSGQLGGSIPVIDVRGRILLGYSPSAIDAALGARM